MKIIVLLFILLAHTVTIAANFVIRINCGDQGSYIDTSGNVWDPDTSFGSGDPSRYKPYNGPEDPLYGSNRYFSKWKHTKPFQYNIQIPENGMMAVKLLFVETFFNAPAKRQFDILVEGTVVAPDLDVFAEAGLNNLYELTVTVPVSDGFVTIELVDKIQNPFISGIEITSAGTLAPTPTPTTGTPTTLAPTTLTGFAKRVNCGGNAFIDPAGNAWEADGFWLSGEPSSPKPTGNPAYDGLYGTNRYFSKWKHTKPFQYEIPLPTESLVTVNLLFVETFFTAVDKRVFDVYVDGNLVQASLDIFAEVGANALLTLSVEVAVFDGSVTIELVEQTQNPIISGIEILDAGELPPSAAPTPGPIFDPLYINCGADQYIGTDGTVWQSDQFFVGGGTFARFANPIALTDDDRLFQTERNGEFSYEIPVPVGVFDVTLYFAELYFELPNYRVFNINVENTVFENVDVVALGGGTWLVPAQIAIPGLIVSDGFINIDFTEIFGKNVPKISAISVTLQGPHYAHSVPDITGNLGYTGVDVDGDNFEAVEVDATNSHTHFEGQSLNRWTWTEGNTIIGEGEQISLTLSVGEHNVRLEVEDTAGNLDALNTTVTVLEQGYPLVYSLTPESGDVAGNTLVMIYGTAFSTVTEVRIGSATLSVGEFNIVDDETIEFYTPYYGVGVPAAVSVINSYGQSNSLQYLYVGETPIEFNVTKLLDFVRPTALVFGPDLKLYVANSKGQIGKFTLNEDFTEVVDSVISSPLDVSRKILGLAIDPLDTSENPTLYCGSSVFYHGGFEDSSGTSINGMIHAISGSNLDVVTDIITGLPVSDLDHGINGLTFGENGELYFLSGSNTNGGIPGALSSTYILDENYYSASAMVAHLGEPGFNGTITYDAPVQGNPITGFGPLGVEVFAAGLRNPFGITWHPNGYIYATENGPNKGFGDMAVGCGPNDFIPSQYGKDRLQLLEGGNYYGHPNRKRGETDPRQCVYHPFNEASNGGYTGPLMPLDSSSDGITVYEAAYFKGQMRGNLIISQYGAGLKRVILSADGRSVIPPSIPEIPLAGDDGLSVALAPNGYLIDARYPTSTMYYYKPIEDPSTEMKIMSVFPRRGALAGGSTLYVFGKNFNGGTPTVIVGGNTCTNPFLESSSKISCTLPIGTLGRKDVSVTIGGVTDTFLEGYKYITGVPAR